jgi:hypothetical protein
MRQGPNKFCFSVGPICLLLQILWETLHYAATGLWPEDTCAPSFPVIRDVLPSAHAAVGAFQSLPDWFCEVGATGL